MNKLFPTRRITRPCKHIDPGGAYPNRTPRGCRCCYTYMVKKDKKIKRQDTCLSTCKGEKSDASTAFKCFKARNREPLPWLTIHDHGLGITRNKGLVLESGCPKGQLQISTTLLCAIDYTQQPQGRKRQRSTFTAR